MQPFLVLFIAVDIIATIAVLTFVLKRRKAALGDIAGTPAIALDFGTLRALSAFAKEQHPRIGNFVSANWSGIPDQLPGVLTSLLDQLEADAKARSLVADRDMLKTVIEASLRSHHIGKGSELNEAFAKVA